LPRLHRALATLTTALVATTIGLVVLAEPAAARPAPGTPGAFYPRRVYHGVTMDLSRPYVWLNNNNVWVYAKANILLARSLELSSGILKIRDYTSGQTRQVIASDTSSSANWPTQLVLQPDSNLVLYRDNGTVVWATNAFCNNAAGEGSVLALQDDGNIVVYCTSGWGEPNILRAAWASGVR
jgi:hypothetical protein